MDPIVWFVFQAPIKTLGTAKNVNLTLNFTIEMNQNE